MGARLPREAHQPSNPDVSRYLCDVRVLGVALGLVLACAVAGCSGSGSGSGSASAAAEIHPNTAASCSLLKRLHATGDIVRQVNVKDPAAFDAAMQRAVRKYTDTLDELHRVAPRN